MTTNGSMGNEKTVFKQMMTGQVFDIEHQRCAEKEALKKKEKMKSYQHQQKRLPNNKIKKKSLEDELRDIESMFSKTNSSKNYRAQDDVDEEEETEFLPSAPILYSSSNDDQPDIEEKIDTVTIEGYMDFFKIGLKANQVCIDGIVIDDFKDDKNYLFKYIVTCERSRKMRINGISSFLITTNKNSKSKNGDAALISTTYTYVSSKRKPVEVSREVVKAFIFRHPKHIDEQLTDEILKEMGFINGLQGSIERNTFRETVFAPRSKRLRRLLNIDKVEEFACFIVHEELEILGEYYSKKKLLEMGWREILKLYNTFVESPWILCCNRLHNFNWPSEDPLEDSIYISPSEFEDNGPKQSTIQINVNGQLLSTGPSYDTSNIVDHSSTATTTTTTTTSSYSSNKLNNDNDDENINKEDNFLPEKKSSNTKTQNKPVELVKIPELELDDILKRTEIGQPDDFTKAWITIYKIVKEDYYLKRNMYSRRVIIDVKVNEDTFSAGDIEKAWNFLLNEKTPKILIEIDERVYLYRVYVAEKMVSTVIEGLCKRFLMGIKVVESRFDPETNITTPSYPLHVNVEEFRSSERGLREMMMDTRTDTGNDSHIEFSEEQKRAISVALNSPVSLIMGKPGGGKSEIQKYLIRLLLKNYSPFEAPKLFVSAMQRKNASAFSDVCPQANICFNLDRLAIGHMRCCHKCEEFIEKQKIFREQQRRAEMEQNGFVNEGKRGFSQVRGKRKLAQIFDEEKEKEMEGLLEEEKKEERKIMGPNGKPLFKDESLGIVYESCIFENVEWLIIDETGLVDMEKMSLVLYGMWTCSPNFKGIIFAGDKYQLSSIYPGDFIVDIENLTRKFFNSCVELTKNFRSQHELLSDNQEAIKKMCPENIIWDHESFVYKHVSKPEWNIAELKRSVWEILDEYELDPTSSHFITQTRHMTQILNEIIEDFYIGRPERELIALTGVKRLNPYRYDKHRFMKGCKIIIKINDGTTTNNEILIVTHIFDQQPDGKQKFLEYSTDHRNSEDARFIVAQTFKGANRLIPLTAETKKAVVKGWATTNYLFIGDGTDDIVYVQNEKNQYETVEDPYTAITRTKQRLFFIGNMKTFEDTCKRPASERNISLCETFEEAFIKETPDILSFDPIPFSIQQLIKMKFSDGVFF